MRAIAKNIWVAEGVFCAWGCAGHTRMTVVRLDNGNLWVHSPIAPTDALVQWLKSLGQVAWVIAPNSMHYMYFEKFLAAFPLAQGYVSAALVRKHARFGAYQPIQGHVAAWVPLQAHTVQGHGIAETVFYHPPSATLITSDLLYNVGPEAFWLERITMFLSGAYGRVAVPVYHRLVVTSQNDLAKSLRTILQWPFQRVIVGHGQVVEDKASAQFAQAWAWAIKRG
ncbi:MAG: DUF4336 domain-containing protein [Alphaproteobacteria bacterium]